MNQTPKSHHSKQLIACTEAGFIEKYFLNLFLLFPCGVACVSKTGN
jgi:hypothetical protein